MIIPQIIKVTKELLLEKHSEETYMTYYLGIHVSKQLVVSPLRPDNHPTACFFREKKNNELLFTDFGINFRGNFIIVVMKLFHIGYFEAINKIAIDFGIIKGPDNTIKKVPIQESKITIQEQDPSIISPCIKNFTKEELNWWNTFGITEKTLKKFEVFSCSQYSLNGYFRSFSSTSMPIYAYYGGMLNKHKQWRLYFPLKKDFRFISNYKSNYIQGVRQVTNKKDLIIITKSLKDIMTLYECGIPAIAPNSEGVVLSKIQIKYIKHRFKKIFILFDNDKAGQKGANKYYDTYKIPCIFINPVYSKDISDLYKNNNKKVFAKAIKDLKNICNGKINESEYFNIKK